MFVGYKEMLTFSVFFNHRTLHFSDFHLHFSSTKCNGQCFSFNFNLGTSVMDHGLYKATAYLSNLFPQLPRLL